MKGIVLCGGLGTRLKPLTSVLNKHLLPVHLKPMCYYPLESMASMGIENVMVVVGGKSTGDILNLLKDGSEFGLKLYYAYQRGETGIAGALALAESFVGRDSCCVILGDNVFGESLLPYAETFFAQSMGARVLLKEVENPQEYGIPQFLGKTLKYIEEKPRVPQCNLAVTGAYFYDHTLFDKIRLCKPSERGELEITDVNNLYAVEGTLRHSVLKSWWGDAGSSLESLYTVTEYVRLSGANKPQNVEEPHK